MSKVLPLALALSLGLSCAIAWEVQDDGAGPQWPSSPAAEPAAVSLARAAETDDLVEARAAAILDRPLFRKGRRPDKPVQTGSRADPAYRLTGVITSSSGKLAIFKAGDGLKSQTVREGGRLGDFVLRSIGPGRAVVEINGDLRTLTPSFAERAPNPHR